MFIKNILPTFRSEKLFQLQKYFRFVNPECPTINLTMRAKPAFLPSALLQGDTRRFNFQEKLIYLWSFREELAIIENRILEKELLAKKKAEKRAKNIAVNKITLYLYIWMKIIFIAISGSHTNCFMTSCANLQKHNTIL